MYRKTFIALAAVALTSCASMHESILFGAGAGAAAGTGVGTIVEQSVGSALIGAAIGGILGGAAGYLAHDKENEASASDNSDPMARARVKPLLNNELPSLLTPEASCTELEERVEGDKYFGPQIMCTIEKPAVWSK